MTCKSSSEDYRWLVSDHARDYCELASRADGSLVKLAKRLRRDLSPQRTHLVMELADLRKRAAAKFARASEMFFTRQLLEQATDERVASYKACRFSNGTSVADICCGIGGDLFALSKTGFAAGIDKDAIATFLAAANGRVLGCGSMETRTIDAAESDISRFAAWHIDPDRRASGRRAADPAAYEPSIDCIDQLRDENAHAAVKLAPAASVPKHWEVETELEWIESRGECRQQVAWFGTLANQPGRRRATVLTATDATTFIGDESHAADVATTIPRFVFEPAAAVFASGLDGALAVENGLSRLSVRAGYLVGDQTVDSGLFHAFEVMDVLPMDIRRIKAYLRERKFGNLEIKKRGVDVSPVRLQKELRVAGNNSSTLIIAPFQRGTVALFVRRC